MDNIEIHQRAEYASMPNREEIAGMYLEGEAEGAYANGTRIIKVEAEEGDGTSVGTAGYVLASFDVSEAEVEADRKVTFFYFVKFDDFPHPIGISDWKIGREATL